VASWNLHRVRTAGNKSPLALHQLSKEKATNRGYWTGDPGDDIETASDPLYGQDPAELSPPFDELAHDPRAPDSQEYPNVSAEREAGILVNDDREICKVQEILKGLGVDWLAEDGNWGIDVYCHAVVVVTSHFMS
jgi:hypothetical protein